MELTARLAPRPSSAGCACSAPARRRAVFPQPFPEGLCEVCKFVRRAVEEPITGIAGYCCARRLMPLIEGFAASVTEAATRFALSHPAMGVILVGMATPQQFEDALAAVQKGPLPPAALERRRWVASLVVGILIALLIAAGAFVLLVAAFTTSRRSQSIHRYSQGRRTAAGPREASRSLLQAAKGKGGLADGLAAR
jgi:hypothetical protein